MKRIVLILVSASCFLSASEHSTGITLNDDIITEIVCKHIYLEPTALDGLAQVSKLALSQKALGAQLRSQPMVRTLLALTTEKTSNVFGALYLLKATGRIDQDLYNQLEFELKKSRADEYESYKQLIANYKDALTLCECDTIKKGLEQGVRPNILGNQSLVRSHGRYTALFAAIFAHDIPLLQTVLKHPKTDVTKYSIGSALDYSPLHRAALYSTTAVVAQLLGNSRVNCNAVVQEYVYRNNKHAVDCGQTPLVRVVYELLSSYDQRLVDNALTLIQSDRVDVLLPDIKGRTALHYAALTGDSVEPIVRAISARHPRLNISQMIDARGKSPLWYAADYGYSLISQALEEHEKNRAIVENN